MNIRRAFTLQDQATFAALSGDCNPMHLDPVQARRTQAGAPVVHGLHVLLWALEQLQAGGAAIDGASAMRVQFSRFVYLDREVEVVEGPASRDGRRFAVRADGQTLVSINLRFQTRGERGGGRDLDLAPVAVPASPALLSLPEMGGRTGWLSPHSPPAAFAQAFPHLARSWDARRVQALATLSSLVGMVCPGLHSVFSRLEVELLATVPAPCGIGFSSSVDERFRLVDLRVHGSGIAGKVSAYARHPPVEPRGMAEIASVVGPGEFEGVRALVVGGSRGLGATTAKVIAAGGGKALITFALAAAEAEAVAADIRSCRGEDACELFQLDVLDPAARDLRRLQGRVTHLFYFATPQIFQQGAAAFHVGTFLRFTEAYVIAFEAICNSLRSDEGLTVFYPSSTAVEQRPRGMAEYSMAKAAGEILCAEMAAHDERLRVHVARLPRVLTDQTATVTPVASADALDTMLPLVRALAAQGWKGRRDEPPAA